MANEPRTLQEAIIYFADPKNCYDYVVPRRWVNGVVLCPTCGSAKVSFLANQNKWQCSARHPKRQFSLKTGTIFEDSPLGMDKWLTAMWLLVNCKNGVSSYELGRAIGVSQKSAWHMLHRLRVVVQDENHTKLSGEVEVDESFIGGKARNMHADRRERMMQGANKGKTIAVGIVERGGKVRTAVVERRRKKELQDLVRKHVEVGSAVFSDELLSYDGLSDDFKHCVINHALEYVNGNVHTNTMENFWCLVKRQLKGTYVNVEPFHLFRYLDEQAYRYNYRKMTDPERFNLAVMQAMGKRLTWNEVTGKDADGNASWIN